jgi:hypothetical protein
MPSIEELRREALNRYELYETARNDWLESETDLEFAIEEEIAVRQSTDRARKHIFWSLTGFALAVAMITIWN